MQMHNNDSPRYSPLPKNASIAAASDLRSDQIRHTEAALHNQLGAGERVPIKAPASLKVSNRALVATFLLPYEATIDLEDGRKWVWHVPKQSLTCIRRYPQEEAIPHCTHPYVI
jgi:hypothetical protein